MNELPCVESLSGDRKLINACRQAGFIVHNPRGPFNGYGYEKLPLAVTLHTAADVRRFNEVRNQIVPSPVLTREELKARWCKRLATRTGITLEEAQQIAEEKEEYQSDQIAELENRQCDRPSRKREALINKIRRSNPLRYIKDASHAQAILAASNRHRNTNYETLLDEGRDLVKLGEISPTEVRDFARGRI